MHGGNVNRRLRHSQVRIGIEQMADAVPTCRLVGHIPCAHATSRAKVVKLKPCVGQEFVRVQEGIRRPVIQYHEASRSVDGAESVQTDDKDQS